MVAIIASPSLILAKNTPWKGGIEMPIVEVPTQLMVEHPDHRSGQLSPAELGECAQELVEWQKQKGVAEETALLAEIEENSRLPKKEQGRYERLRRKCEARTLTERELSEYQSLLQRLEARNVKRIEALNALAQRRGTTLRGIIQELGLKGFDDVF